MTNEQIQLVQASWEKVMPVAREAGNSFYQKLFAKAPELRHLFASDITEQANKLMQVLGYVVSKLRQPEELLPQVAALGVKHNRYGAQPEHYEAVGQCLIATLAEGLGKEWTPEVKDAWITAYNTLKNVMIVAQERARQEVLTGN